MSDAASNKPIICIDFDGVIHSYEHGWRGGVIYGELVPGFLDWVEEARLHFKLAIYSSRSGSPDNLHNIVHWTALKVEMASPWRATDYPNAGDLMPTLRFLDAKRAEVLTFIFPRGKPAAYLTIDDRAIQFRGDWKAPELQPPELEIFQPWNARRIPHVGA